MWVSIKEKFPMANKNLNVILSGGSSVRARTELHGKSILIKYADGSGKTINPLDIIWWSEINDPAPPKKPCPACTGRW